MFMCFYQRFFNRANFLSAPSINSPTLAKVSLKVSYCLPTLSLSDKTGVGELLKFSSAHFPVARLNMNKHFLRLALRGQENIHRI